MKAPWVQIPLCPPISNQTPQKPMSAFTTLHITRSKAREIYLQAVIGDIPDKELEAFLDHKLAPAIYNAVVVPDDIEKNDNATADQILQS